MENEENSTNMDNEETGATSEESMPTTNNVEENMSLENLKKLNEVSNYTVKKQEEVQKITNKVKNMGILRRIWEAKVPEINKRFYYFFSLTPINKKDVLDEIENYKNFYDELSKAVRKTRKPEERTEEESEDPFGQIILILKNKLSEIYENAESGINSTPSSSLCKLHKSFIEGHQNLEGMICRVENAILQETIKGMSGKIREYNENVRTLSEEVRNAMENITSKNTDLSNERDELLRKKEYLVFKQTALEQEKKEMKSVIDDLLKINEENEEEIEKLIIRNMEIIEEQRNLHQITEILCQETENLTEKFTKMVLEKERLMTEYQEMQIEVENLLQKNLKLKEEQVMLRQNYWKMEEEQENLRQEVEESAEELKVLKQKYMTTLKIQDILLQENSFLRAQLDAIM